MRRQARPIHSAAGRTFQECNNLKRLWLLAVLVIMARVPVPVLAECSWWLWERTEWRPGSSWGTWKVLEPPADQASCLAAATAMTWSYKKAQKGTYAPGGVYECGPSSHSRHFLTAPTVGAESWATEEDTVDGYHANDPRSGGCGKAEGVRIVRNQSTHDAIQVWSSPVRRRAPPGLCRSLAPRRC